MGSSPDGHNHFVYGLLFLVEYFREKMESTILMASLPETLIVPIAPPGCVAIAQMVSEGLRGLLYACIMEKNKSIVV